MTKEQHEGSAAGASIGGAIGGGPGAVGGSLLGGILDDDRDERTRDLGPAPIGSDPWLVAEVRAALARDRAIDASHVRVDARDAIVTLRGAIEAGDLARIETAARSVQGIKALRIVAEAR